VNVRALGSHLEHAPREAPAAPAVVVDRVAKTYWRGRVRAWTRRPIVLAEEAAA
jgi:hypothetical protein